MVPPSGTVTLVGAMVTPVVPVSPSVAVTSAMVNPSYLVSVLLAVCVKVAVPATASSSGAAARVTVWAVFQVAEVNVREAPALTVRSASPLARATAIVTSAVGWLVSRTV